MDDHVTLQPPFRGDSINAGKYFFARIDNNHPPTAKSWGLVMVVTPDLLPQVLLDAKRRAERRGTWKTGHPCWLMGQARL